MNCTILGEWRDFRILQNSMKVASPFNITVRTIFGSEILKEHFGECIHADDISDLEFPAKDTKIWQYAKDNGYTVITHDNDFNNFISIRGFPPKIVWLKTGNCSRKITADVLIRSKQAIEELLSSKEYGLLEIF